jgi:hypothetical protein
MEDWTMRIALLPGLTNVVRFPVERRARPTLALLRDMAPDPREVLAVAEAFALDAPAPDLRDRTDAETAEHILNQIVETGEARTHALDALLEPVVARAVTVCRAAHDAAGEAVEARQVLLRALTARHPWIEPSQERAETLTFKATELLIEAHVRSEEAEGVARAVGIARRGETWTPRDPQADAAALFFGMAG